MARNASAQRLEIGIESDHVNRAVTRRSELEYLADLLPQLRSMAFGLDEKTLAYLLEMATMEAKLQLQLELESAG